MTIGTVNPDYGDASAPPPPWSDVEQRLTDARLYWLVTVRRDGRPHPVPLVGVWDGGLFHFCTGRLEQKWKNLEANPRVAVLAGPLGASGWAVGKDISVEGVVERVTDEAALGALADRWRDKYGSDWDFVVRDQQFFQVDEPGGGEHGGADVFRVVPSKALVFGDDHGQTRYPL
jgi:hypothetical protein